MSYGIQMAVAGRPTVIDLRFSDKKKLEDAMRRILTEMSGRDSPESSKSTLEAVQEVLDAVHLNQKDLGTSLLAVVEKLTDFKEDIMKELSTEISKSEEGLKARLAALEEDDVETVVDEVVEEQEEDEEQEQEQEQPEASENKFEITPVIKTNTTGEIVIMMFLFMVFGYIYLIMSGGMFPTEA
jgi:Fe2+ transport system protein B